MPNYREATTSFVNSAKGVTGAVDMLKAAIAGGDPEDINFATELVTNAADNYLGNSQIYQRRGLDEMATQSTEVVLEPERVASDLLAGALIDMSVANSILNVAQAAKQPEVASIEELEENSTRLNNLISVVGLPLGRTIETPTPMTRFGLDEAPTAVSLPTSNNELTAKANYEQQVAEVFTVLVTKSKEVVLTTFESIRGLDFEKILDALGSVGQLAAKLPEVSKIVAKGLAIVTQALEKIAGLLNINREVEVIRTLARKVREYLQDPTRPLEELLQLTYGVAASKTLVQQLLEKTSAAMTNIDEGTKQLVQLRTRFADQMTLLTYIVKGVTTAKGVVNYFSPGAATLPFFGTFYVLAMAYAVLAGMDFADAGGPLNLVSGVVHISKQVLP